MFYSLHPLYFSPPVLLLTLTRDVHGAWERSREFEPEIVQFLVTCNHVIWRARAASRLCRNSRIRRIILWTLDARLASCQTGFVLCIRSMFLLCYSAVSLFFLASISLHLISSLLRWPFRTNVLAWILSAGLQLVVVVVLEYSRFSCVRFRLSCSGSRLILLFLDFVISFLFFRRFFRRYFTISTISICSRYLIRNLD